MAYLKTVRILLLIGLVITAPFALIFTGLFMFIPLLVNFLMLGRIIATKEQPTFKNQIIISLATVIAGLGFYVVLRGLDTIGNVNPDPAAHADAIKWITIGCTTSVMVIVAMVHVGFTKLRANS